MLVHTYTADALQLLTELNVQAQSVVTNEYFKHSMLHLKGKKHCLMMINGCVRLV